MGLAFCLRSRGRLGVMLALAAAAACFEPAPGRAAVPLVPCHASSGVRCATVVTPLDPSGATPGTVHLAVEVLPAAGMARGAMFLIAGGPGQASAKVFDLARNGKRWEQIFPGYTLVAYDDRGTGASDPLSCPNLADAPADSTAQEIAALVGACGSSIGPDRVFYGTPDQAEDIETVRAALGLDRIALWGTSYGTKQVVAYALAHPDHVERLLLDSVLPPQGPDALGTDVLRGIPLGLASMCHGSICRGATADVVADVAALANRLAASPISVPVAVGGGKSVRVRLTGLVFLDLVRDSDLNPGVAAELPAAVTASLRGHPGLLARLAVLDSVGSFEPASEFDLALNLTTVCDDGPFPWGAETAPGDRQASVNAAVAALPAGATGPFGPWAVALGTFPYCTSWPAPSGGAQLAAGPLPDVPVLVLSGDRDMRTPTAGARAVAARFPHAQVLVVPGVGHSVLTTDYSRCAFRGVQAWLNGTTPKQCPRVPPLMTPLARFPASVGGIAPAAGLRGLRGRTVTAALRTLREAEAAWLTAGRATLPGMLGGRLVDRTDDLGYFFRLDGYSDVPGLELTGGVAAEESRPRGSPVGRLVAIVSVSGKHAAHGTLIVRGTSILAAFGGKRVKTHG